MRTAAALLFLAFVLHAQKVDLKEARAEEQFRWGVRAFHNGLIDEAVLSLEKSLSLKPDKALPRQWLGRALFKTGFEEAALNEWKHVLQGGSGNSLLRNLVQILSFRRGLGRELEQRQGYVISSTLDANGREAYPFRRPSSIRARPDGSIYVVAFGSNEIVLLDANHQVLEALRGGIKGFDRPFDCLEIDGRALYITEYGRNRILRCTLKGERIQEFGGPESGEGKLLGPQHMATDGRYLYVTDWGNSRVVKFDLEGRYILSFGSRSTPGSRLSGPSGIAVQEERVYVSDRNGRRLEVFDSSGNFLEAVGEGVLNAPEGIAFDGPDLLMVADGNRVRRFRLARETWEELADVADYAHRLLSVAVTPNGQVYAADFDLNKLFVLSEMNSLYGGILVRVERVMSNDFPQVFVDISVEDRLGNPVVGLREGNFVLTESRRSVGELTLARTNQSEELVEIIAVVERSPALGPFQGEAAVCLEEIYNQLAGKGSMQVLLAGNSPSPAAAFGATRLQTAQAAFQGLGKGVDKDWRFDRAIRLAGTQLIPRRSRQAVVFLSSGRLTERSFNDNSLAELTGLLRNNGIGFYPVVFGAGGTDGELDYIASETRGKSIRYASPAGVRDLVREIRERVLPVYTLSYISPSEPDFGLAYIDLQAEVYAQKRSGRDESGYYAPLSH